MSSRVFVSSADFIRNIGYWQNEAIRNPVHITHHGRDRLVLASPEEFLRDVNASNGLVQNELIKLRSAHALIMEQLEEGYVHFDGQLQVTAANPTCQSLLGQSLSELLGKGPGDLLSGVAASLWMSVLQRVLRTRKCEAFEAPFMGSHLRFKVFPLSDGVATLFENVTELHTLAARLEVSTALEAAVASHPDVASFILDPRGRLDTVSDTFCAATGFDADQLLKTKLVDIVAAPYRRAAVDAIEQTLALRNTSTLEVVILKKTTEELLATLTIAPSVSELSVNSLVGVAFFKPFERVAQQGRVSAGVSLRPV